MNTCGFLAIAAAMTLSPAPSWAAETASDDTGVTVTTVAFSKANGKVDGRMTCMPFDLFE